MNLHDLVLELRGGFAKRLSMRPGTKIPLANVITAIDSLLAQSEEPGLREAIVERLSCVISDPDISEKRVADDIMALVSVARPAEDGLRQALMRIEGLARGIIERNQGGFIGDANDVNRIKMEVVAALAAKEQETSSEAADAIIRATEAARDEAKEEQ